MNTTSMGNATRDLALEIIQHTQELEHAQTALKELSGQVATLESKHASVGSELNQKRSALQQLESQVQSLNQQLEAEQREQLLTAQQKRVKAIAGKINQHSAALKALLVELTSLRKELRQAEDGRTVKACIKDLPVALMRVGDPEVHLHTPGTAFNALRSQGDFTPQQQVVDEMLAGDRQPGYGYAFDEALHQLLSEG